MSRKGWGWVVIMVIAASASVQAADQTASSPKSQTASSTKSMTAVGTISAVDLASSRPMVKLKTSAGSTLNVELSPQTAITQDQKSVKPDQLRVGQRVSITYRAPQGQNVADTIRLRAAAPATSSKSSAMNKSAPAKGLPRTPLPATH